MEPLLAKLTSRRALVPMFVGCSLVLHGGGFAVMSQVAHRGQAEAAQPNTPLDLVMVEVESPKPPPVEEVKEPAPRPRPKPPIKVGSVKVPKPKENLPPPPNDPAPAEEPPRQAPLVVGMTMSSTTTGGAYAAPVGNTLYGKAEPQAQAPQDVKPYSAPRFVPIYQVDSPPAVLSETKIPYPEGARREGIEGTVLLSIVVDVDGNVTNAKVLSGPGHGLNEAARDAIGKFRFKPAIKSGQPVATEMKYKYTFFLN